MCTKIPIKIPTKIFTKIYLNPHCYQNSHQLLSRPWLYFKNFYLKRKTTCQGTPLVATVVVLQVVTYHHKDEEIHACAGGPNYELLVDEIWPWVDIMLYSCLPFLIICVLNIHIIRQVSVCSCLPILIICVLNIHIIRQVSVDSCLPFLIICVLNIHIIRQVSIHSCLPFLIICVLNINIVRQVSVYSCLPFIIICVLNIHIIRQVRLLFITLHHLWCHW